MNSHRLWHQVLKLVIGSVVVLGLTACNLRHRTHEDAKNAATDRWLSARSNLFLQSAQRQFDTGDLTQCERTLAEGLAMDPGNPRLHTLAGRVHIERGQLERAYHRFEAAIELDEDLPEPYYYRGIVLERWQRYDRALASYQSAYELEADNVSYLISVAEMHVAMDDLEAARELLDSRIIYFDQNAGIRIALAHVHAMLLDYRQAAWYMEQALMLQPDDLRTLEDLATMQQASGQYRKAIDSLERLLAERAYHDRADVRHALASCYTKIGRTQRAREHYLALIRMDRSDAEAWVRLGEIAFSDDDLTGALQASQRAIALAPERHDGFLLAGLVWHKRGQTEQALRMFDRAAQAAPDNALPWILRGLTLEQAGRSADATDAYQQALRIEPSDSRAQRLLANVNVP